MRGSRLLISSFLAMLVVAPGVAQKPRAASPPPSRQARPSAQPPASRDNARRNGPAAADTGSRGDSTSRSLASTVNVLLSPRLIGPAMISGRISSIAVDPRNNAVIYAAAASGGVWKTENGGASWSPIFEHEGSYSIGTVVVDPRSPSTVWVGTGENNSQRSVGYGDGVYRSDDGGRTWHNMGLDASEHIARIVIDPRNSDVVYVAAQGPLWSDGGDRGLYKTTDGGKTWTAVLTVSERTGVTDVVLDPRNPDNLLAATYQRRRHVWTLIDGGPESSLQRSTDGGKTWHKVRGIPSGDLGRIGLVVSPVNSDIVYATVEAAGDGGGIFRSSDGGISWEKRSSYTAQPMYYATLIADPVNVDRLYSMDVSTQVSDDGGATWRGLGERSKHGDNHALWIDPANTRHLLSGNDGGLYQSWDGGATWLFFANLPLGQFYDVDVDNATPYYHVCGGTQDNSSVCGPSATSSRSGIINSDWFVTTGGDGFVSRIDPTDPNTVYAESQNGGMVRYDMRTGDEVSIQPQEGAGDPPSRWNWDTPLIISPHSHTRLYTASQRLYRSDDRGNSWRAVSGDLTRQVDRNALPVMGKVWGPDAVAKNQSTAFYSNVTTIAESPKREGLLYIGTDDGLIQVSSDSGHTWARDSVFPGVPANTYVRKIVASPIDSQTAFAVFDNHKNGDFKPYLFRTADAGAHWQSIASNLPDRGGVYSVAQDQIDPALLFAGTEFGAYVSLNGGEHWIRITGLPTIQVRDLAIQRRDNALVIATFGRSIYVADNYAPLRMLGSAQFADSLSVLPIADVAPVSRRGQFVGGGARGYQGEALYTADNPETGARIVWWSRSSLFPTLRDQRRQAERAAERADKPIVYPTPDEFIAEADEEPVTLVASITDQSGKLWRVLTLPTSRGTHSLYWDLRGSTATPADAGPSVGAAASTAGGRGARGGGGGGGGFFGGRGGGGCTNCTTVPPGRYSVTLGKRDHGIITALTAPVSFTVMPEAVEPLSAQDIAGNLEYRAKQDALSRRIGEAISAATDAQSRVEAMIHAINQMSSAPNALKDSLRDVNDKLVRALRTLRGDEVNSARGEQVPVSIQSHLRSASPDGRVPSGTNLEQYQIAASEFEPVYATLRPLIAEVVPALQAELERLGAPATPGRLPGIGP